MNITFWIPPLSFRSGNDIVSPKTTRLLNKAGINTNIYSIWPEYFAKSYYQSIFPSIIEFRIYRYFLNKYFLNTNLKKENEKSISWIWANAAITDKEGYFEKKLKEKNNFIIFHFMDDWFTAGYKEHIIARSKYVDVFVVPTLKLQKRVLEFLPNARVQLLEEPINVYRFLPNTLSIDKYVKPIIVWTGSLHNFYKASNQLLAILTPLSKEAAFTFRVISGNSRPDFNPDFEWEWIPYKHETEAANINGASVGIALSVNKGIYEECKGNYKVKTYLAAGIPVVGSDFGINKSLIKNEVNGYLINSNEECTEKLKLILMNRTLASSLSEGAREYAVSHLSHESILPKWIDFIKTVSK
jgi:glycosyltransferase involved in cell wall biosynthesis